MAIVTYNLQDAHERRLVTESEAAWLLGVTHDFYLAGASEDAALKAITENLQPTGVEQKSGQLLYPVDDLWMFYVTFLGEDESSARRIFDRVMDEIVRDAEWLVKSKAVH